MPSDKEHNIKHKCYESEPLLSYCCAVWIDQNVQCK